MGESFMGIVSPAPSAHRSIAERIRERLRYGLLRQEVIDRLAKAQVYIHPYYLVKDSAPYRYPPHAHSRKAAVARLDERHTTVIATLAGRPLPVERVARRFQTATCFGLFVEGRELAGYTWVRFDVVPTGIGKGVLFKLDRDGAYVFDTYVARAHRGHRLAAWLRTHVNRALVELGRDQIYSLTFAFNSSARRFKARLGAVEIEKRLTYGYRPVFARDVRLERLTSDPLPTPRAMRLPPRRHTSYEHAHRG
jgi:GNAT superfamily N-acetyltransferase